MSKSLAERAIMCKHWRWRPGMLAQGNYRVVTVTQSGYPNGCGADYHDSQCWELSAESLPDLDDAATLGCLLALVREAWDDSLFAYSDGKIWAVQGPWRGPFFHSETEAEALIKALEEAP